jgi:type I restriction-modification system DNA methylase subunit
VARENERIKKTGEIFTPTKLVQKILNDMSAELFMDPNKTFLDNSCGNGQFLSEVLIKKLENNISFDKALSTIYSVDIMLDNIDICRNRLLCGQEQYRHIVERNIVCGDALTFNYYIWDDDS